MPEVIGALDFDRCVHATSPDIAMRQLWITGNQYCISYSSSRISILIEGAHEHRSANLRVRDRIFEK
jgi:hypothetical protein